MDDLSEKLPAEVLHGCFNVLNLEDLARISQVSRRWKDLATDHPTYWKCVCIEESSSRLVPFFLARLREARGRATTVRVIVPEVVDHLSTTILPAVAIHAQHMVELTIQVHADMHEAAFAALGGFMPLLERLTLHFTITDPNATAPVLPTDTFRAWTSTKLRYIELEGVGLPAVPLPVLSTVVAFNYEIPGPPSPPIREDVFAAFPNMKSLILHGEIIDGFDYVVLPACSRVNFVQFSQSLNDAVLSMPLATVPHIAVDTADERLAQCVLSHLDGPLYMVMVDTEYQSPDTFRFELFNDDRTRARTFIERLHNYTADNGVPLSLLYQPAFFERIVKLDVSDTLWNTLTPFVTAVPVLKTLCITLQALGLLDLTSTLHCPALSEICLLSYGAKRIAVDAVHLRNFTVRAITGAQLPLRLCLDQGVALHNDSNALLDVYNDVKPVVHPQCVTRSCRLCVQTTFQILGRRSLRGVKIVPKSDPFRSPSRSILNY